MTEVSPKQINEMPEASEEDYQLIEQALLQNPRGRWFLEEYINRNRPEDTQKLLSAIQRIENNLTNVQNQPHQQTNPADLDPIRLSIIEMSKAIAKTREEINSIKPEDQEDNQLVSATEELSAIVESTEKATNTILEAAEEIQEAAWVLREAGAADEPCDKIDNNTTDIYTACSFQDITGQRTTKVVEALVYIENRVNAMIDIWGLDEFTSTDVIKESSETRPDAHLLNGPAKLGEELHQDCVDGMMSDSESIPDAEDGADLADSISFDTIDEGEAETINIDDMNFDGIEAEAPAAEMPAVEPALEEMELHQEIKEEQGDITSDQPSDENLQAAINAPLETEAADQMYSPETSSEQPLEALSGEVNENTVESTQEQDTEDLTSMDFGDLEISELDPTNLEETALDETFDVSATNPLMDEAVNHAVEAIEASEQPITEELLSMPETQTEPSQEEITSEAEMANIDEVDIENLSEEQKEALLNS